MSIEKMIAEHPDVTAESYNEALGKAVHHTMTCAAICNSCADACVAETADMRQCIRLCLDCADVCTATYRVASRRTGGDRQLIRTLLASCIEACERTAEECDRHDFAHCKRCALMCRECVDDCRAALVVLNQEAHAAGSHKHDVRPPDAASPAS
jgi:hypothetical protein